MIDSLEQVLQESAARTRQAIDSLPEADQEELHRLARVNMQRAAAGEQPPRFELWGDGVRLVCLLDTERGAYTFVESDVLEQAFAHQATVDSLGTN